MVTGCGRVRFDPWSTSGSRDAQGDSTVITVGTDGPPPVDAVIPDGFVNVAESFGEGPSTNHKGVTADTYLDSTATSSNFGTTADLVGGASPSRTILLRFDLSALPTNAIVTSAELVVTTGSDTDDLLASVYQANETWSETTATWNLRDTALRWTDAGARPPTSRSVTAVHGYVPSTANVGAGMVFDANGVALIQSWVSNAASNAGFAITGAGASFSIHASTAATATYRPGLYLEVAVPM